MTFISTGQPSTLKTYRIIAELLFGKDSEAITFIQKEIWDSPNGENEEVVADERQMLYLLAQIAAKDRK